MLLRAVCLVAVLACASSTSERLRASAPVHAPGQLDPNLSKLGVEGTTEMTFHKSLSVVSELLHLRRDAITRASDRNSDEALKRLKTFEDATHAKLQGVYTRRSKEAKKVRCHGCATTMAGGGGGHRNPPHAP